ncbi:faciogenital dysplasia protein [Anaeramoeba flamelloides]|uniref:Faciogenital dysplasia protein n=1 Tax=Anaeramoeba flamelloides TaxID=1746091 RepID=A0AAV8ACH6_9EUKA|nr:faciogenital dysplasia protein [Anaeramoeba flamelloides]
MNQTNQRGFFSNNTSREWGKKTNSYDNPKKKKNQWPKPQTTQKRNQNGKKPTTQINSPPIPKRKIRTKIGQEATSSSSASTTPPNFSNRSSFPKKQNTNFGNESQNNFPKRTRGRGRGRGDMIQGRGRGLGSGVNNKMNSNIKKFEKKNERGRGRTLTRGSGYGGGGGNITGRGQSIHFGGKARGRGMVSERGRGSNMNSNIKKFEKKNERGRGRTLKRGSGYGGGGNITGRGKFTQNRGQVMGRGRGIGRGISSNMNSNIKKFENKKEGERGNVKSNSILDQKKTNFSTSQNNEISTQVKPPPIPERKIKNVNHKTNIQQKKIENNPWVRQTNNFQQQNITKPQVKKRNIFTNEIKKYSSSNNNNNNHNTNNSNIPKLKPRTIKLGQYQQDRPLPPNQKNFQQNKNNQLQNNEFQRRKSPSIPPQNNNINNSNQNNSIQNKTKQNKTNNNFRNTSRIDTSKFETMLAQNQNNTNNQTNQYNTTQYNSKQNNVRQNDPNKKNNNIRNNLRIDTSKFETMLTQNKNNKIILNNENNNNNNNNNNPKENQKKNNSLFGGFKSFKKEKKPNITSNNQAKNQTKPNSMQIKQKETMNKLIKKKSFNNSNTGGGSVINLNNIIKKKPNPVPIQSPNKIITKTNLNIKKEPPRPTRRKKFAEYLNKNLKNCEEPLKTFYEIFKMSSQLIEDLSIYFEEFYTPIKISTKFTQLNLNLVSQKKQQILDNLIQMCKEMELIDKENENNQSNIISINNVLRFLRILKLNYFFEYIKIYNEILNLITENENKCPNVLTLNGKHSTGTKGNILDYLYKPFKFIIEYKKQLNNIELYLGLSNHPLKDQNNLDNNNFKNNNNNSNSNNNNNNERDVLFLFKFQNQIYKFLQEITLIKKKYDYLFRLVEIHYKFLGANETNTLPIKIIDPRRHLIQEGDIKQVIKTKLNERYFFLFNDILILCKVKNRSKLIFEQFIRLNPETVFVRKWVVDKKSKNKNKIELMVQGLFDRIIFFLKDRFLYNKFIDHLIKDIGLTFQQEIKNETFNEDNNENNNNHNKNSNSYFNEDDDEYFDNDYVEYINKLSKKTREELEKEKEKEKNILEKLPKGSKTDIETRANVVIELIMTEREYVKDLNRIMIHFYNPILERKLVSKSDFPKIFSSIEVIFKLNRQLLSILEIQFPGENDDAAYVDVGSIIYKFGDNLKLYSDYCSHHELSMKTINKYIQQGKEFATFIQQKKLEEPDCKNLGLLDYLIMPIQRICKYPLLFREMLKSTKEDYKDYENLKNAYLKLQTVANYVNEKKRAFKEAKILIQISNKIMFIKKGFQLMVPNRKFIMEDKLRKKSVRKTQKRQFWLFTDLILYAQKTKKEKYLFKGVLYIASAIIRDFQTGTTNQSNSNDDNNTNNNKKKKKKNDLCFQIIPYGVDKGYIIFCDSVEQKRLWITKIQEQIDYLSKLGIMPPKKK